MENPWFVFPYGGTDIVKPEDMKHEVDNTLSFIHLSRPLELRVADSLIKKILEVVQIMSAHKENILVFLVRPGLDIGTVHAGFEDIVDDMALEFACGTYEVHDTSNEGDWCKTPDHYLFIVKLLPVGKATPFKDLVPKCFQPCVLNFNRDNRKNLEFFVPTRSYKGEASAKAPDDFTDRSPSLHGESSGTDATDEKGDLDESTDAETSPANAPANSPSNKVPDFAIEDLDNQRVSHLEMTDVEKELLDGGLLDIPEDGEDGDDGEDEDHAGVGGGAEHGDDDDDDDGQDNEGAVGDEHEKEEGELSPKSSQDNAWEVVLTDSLPLTAAGTKSYGPDSRLEGFIDDHPLSKCTPPKLLIFDLRGFFLSARSVVKSDKSPSKHE
ncbi:hypothetical protein R1sor_004888 [Riccia sorocarpa]|uniref:Uncharacterized protein n=1 Tax=Riccia sorocarpa TaxID=122646 RepID=A0ABD3HKX3_9MARC